ncbi:MAG: glycine betaine ABC transporter substrate-binding protein [Candidatus Caenarcaniphilales bacterium]|nr:glycine betaine ABC transporter substrate-binding protein [Candidatus Caenarcaniphilales bacterium]
MAESKNFISIKFLIIVLVLLISACTKTPEPKSTIKVGSKKFIESMILGEIATQFLQDRKITAKHITGMGSSTYLWNALLTGKIDLYPEYTGTLRYELIKTHDQDLNEQLKRRGLRMTKPLGFSNNYTIGIMPKLAKRYQISKISDLVKYPELKVGLSSEFYGRTDGWIGLKNLYQLPQENIIIINRELAYSGLKNGDIDLIELYTTDPEIEYYELVPLKDDLQYFPIYEVAFLYREELDQSVVEVLERLEGQISEEQIRKLNSMSKLMKTQIEDVASLYLQRNFDISNGVHFDLVGNLWERTVEHFYLVFLSLSIAIAFALPLGIFAAKDPFWGRIILAITGLFQTIPSLALLVLMIPLLGIGYTPAIAALIIYSLLPIVRNIYLGLTAIAQSLRESAEVLGLDFWAILWKIEIPLALPSILAGIKTAAVINVGTATLGALIGAGGYGQPILKGIQFDDLNLILSGAVPAAAMALLVQYFFETLEWLCVSPGLRSYLGKS